MAADVLKNPLLALNASLIWIDCYPKGKSSPTTKIPKNKNIHPSRKNQDSLRPYQALKTPKQAMRRITSIIPIGIRVIQTILMMGIRDLQVEDLLEAEDDHQEEDPWEAVPQEEEEEDHLVRPLTPMIQTLVTLERISGCPDDLKDQHHHKIRLRATTKQDFDLTKGLSSLRSLLGMAMAILS